MGLDWIPGPKPQAGHEREFKKLWRELNAEVCDSRKAKVARFKEITICPFDTLKAPRVGIDGMATAWARNISYPQRRDKTLSVEAYVEAIKGAPVVGLVGKCDGLQPYINHDDEGHFVKWVSFRGEHLRDCLGIIGANLLAGAYKDKPPGQTVRYGERLLAAAAKVAAANGVDLATVSSVRRTGCHFAESIEGRLDVVACAGRWCVFWGTRGHGMVVSC